MDSMSVSSLSNTSLSLQRIAKFTYCDRTTQSVLTLSEGINDQVKVNRERKYSVLGPAIHVRINAVPNCQTETEVSARSDLEWVDEQAHVCLFIFGTQTPIV